MKTLKILGFSGALVAAAIVGGTLMSVVSASPNAPAANGSPGGLAVDTQAGQFCQTFLNEFAKNLGVDESALLPAAKKAADAAIDTAVASGNLPKAIGDAMKQRIANANGDGCALLGARFRGLFRHTIKAGIGQDMAQAAATSLHLSVADLKTKLMGGESLQQIAKGQNVDYATLTTAIEGAAKTDLDKLVTAGTISKDRETQILNRIDQALKNGRLWGRGARTPGGAAASPAASGAPAT
jgi:hypothetical protein